MDDVLNPSTKTMQSKDQIYAWLSGVLTVSLRVAEDTHAAAWGMQPDRKRYHVICWHRVPPHTLTNSMLNTMQS
jgi:hypothetical protein